MLKIWKSDNKEIVLLKWRENLFCLNRDEDQLLSIHLSIIYLPFNPKNNANSNYKNVTLWSPKLYFTMPLISRKFLGQRRTCTRSRPRRRHLHEVRKGSGYQEAFPERKKGIRLGRGQALNNLTSWLIYIGKIYIINWIYYNIINIYILIISLIYWNTNRIFKKE